MKNNILCLDDERSIRFSLERTLRREYSFISVASQQEALRSLEKNIPDIFLCDQFVEDGELLGFLKVLEETYPSLKVLILTGDQYSEAVIEAKQIDFCYGVISKPFHSKELKETIEKTLAIKEV